MREKKCFKCGEIKPLDDFYTHKRMKDGHLNKCKKCTRSDVKSNYDEKSKNEDWLEKERLRGREKFKRLCYAGKFKQTKKLCQGIGNISKKLRVKGYDTTNKEAHHWNYNEPHSIFLIKRKSHRRIHSHLMVNYEDKFCYTEDGLRLNTAEQAKRYFEHILDMYGISENLEPITV